MVGVKMFCHKEIIERLEKMKKERRQNFFEDQEKDR